jgi:oligopeptide/dipeptide ABC transporter ATP-binding protein
MTYAQSSLLQVNDLVVEVKSARGVGRAVDGVSFSIAAGETLGLVGESGSGKSLTCLSVVRLNPKPATRIAGGSVSFDGQELLERDQDAMRAYRGREIAMILQDPMTSLNPVLTIVDQIGEALRLHRGLSGAAQEKVAQDLLTRLRVPEPIRVLRSYPHELSGGMCQRVVGAIALAGKPRLLIADEPTTALDVTVQAAYLALLRRLQREEGLAILFITHDLGAVTRICDRVAVMYGGRIVESASTADLFSKATHPYSQALLRSMPDVSAPPRPLEPIPGQPPSVFAERKGCLFAPRCPEAQARCHEQEPPMVALENGHVAACWARQ